MPATVALTMYNHHATLDLVADPAPESALELSDRHRHDDERSHATHGRCDDRGEDELRVGGPERTEKTPRNTVNASTTSNVNSRGSETNL